MTPSLKNSGIEKLWFNDSMCPSGESSTMLNAESGVFQPAD